MKKFLAVICAIAMIMAMSVVAFATGSPIAPLDANDPFIKQLDEAGIATLGGVADLLGMECPEERRDDPIVAVYKIEEGVNSFDVEKEIADGDEISDYEMAYAPDEAEALDIQALTGTAFDYESEVEGYAFLAKILKAE